jgi:hypothetical protein
MPPVKVQFDQSGRPLANVAVVVPPQLSKRGKQAVRIAESQAPNLVGGLSESRCGLRQSDRTENRLERREGGPNDLGVVGDMRCEHVAQGPDAPRARQNSHLPRVPRVRRIPDRPRCLPPDGNVYVGRQDPDEGGDDAATDEGPDSPRVVRHVA